MTDFKFVLLTPKHKKKFVFQKIFIFLLMGFMTFIAIKKTNPSIVETSEKMSVTIGAMIGLVIFLMATFNRLKTLFKIKFATFVILWLFLLSLRSIIDTAIWSFGLLAIPMAIDDIIILPYWKKLWYNEYER